MAFDPARHQQVPASEMQMQWLKTQIERCPSPVPPALVDLVYECARRAVSPSSAFKLDEEFLVPFQQNLAFPYFLQRLDVALLCLYYVLSYKEACASAATDGVDYSPRFYTRLPIRFLLALRDEGGGGSDSNSYLMVKLLGSVAALCPQDLPNVESMVYGVAKEVETSLASFEPDIQTVAPLHNVSILEQCQRLSELAVELESTKHRSAIEETQLKRVWCRLESLLPRLLYAAVLRRWLLLSSQTAIDTSQLKGGGCDDDEMLLQDPTVLFRVDDRYLLSPLHVWCLVRMLAYYLNASASEGQLKLLACKTTASIERFQEAYNLACIQNSALSMAVVCLLLELAGKAKSAQVPVVCQAVCDQIHRMFIEEPKLVQLVHYQGYPLELIPIMVEHVPSAHVLITSINELLLYQDVGRRLFGIHLIARLVDKYRTPNAFAGVKLVVEMLDTTLAQCGLDDKMVDLLDAALPALVLIIKVSPTDVLSLRATLSRVVKMLRCRLALLTCDWQPIDAATKDKQLLSKVNEALKMAEEEARKCTQKEENRPATFKA